jgi:tight adherence protein B
VPYIVLSFKASRRQKAFDEQLPNILMTMSASVRVGHSFRQAMQAVVNEGQEPASKEFGRVLLETDLGRPVDQALEEMAQRLNSSHLDYVIQAVTIQRQVGGSLSGLFDMVADTVRHRQQFLAKVKGLTAQARLSAYILTGMPFVALGVLTLSNRHYATPLFTTSTGRILLLVGLAGIIFGGLILKRMVSFRLS